MANWNPSEYPTNDTKIGSVPQVIREISRAIEDLIEREHSNISGNYNTSVGTYSGAIHKEGSARVFIDNYAGDPNSVATTGPHGELLSAMNDDGRFLYDTSTDILWYYLTDSWVKFEFVSSNILDSAVITAKIAADAVTAAKIQIGQNIFLRGRNALDAADVNILKVNASDEVEMAGNVDFAQNEAKQFVIENRTADPSSPVVGQIWFRTDV